MSAEQNTSVPEPTPEQLIVTAIISIGRIGASLMRGTGIWGNDSAMALARRLQLELEEVLRNYNSPVWNGLEVGCRFAAVLRGDYHSSAKDPMLCFLVATEARQEQLASSFQRSAWNCYQQNFVAYDAVFEQLIPATWSDCAQSIQREQDYMSGRNNTAHGDWDQFQVILSQQAAQDSFTLGPSTGLPRLDEHLGGVWGTTIIGGDRGVGKTSLMIQMAMSVLRTDPTTAVMFGSLDMDKTQLYKRLMCNLSGVPFRNLMLTNKSDCDKQLLETANAELPGLLRRLQVIERTSSLKRDGLTLEFIVERYSQLMKSSGATKFYVFLDLFQRIDCPPELQNDADRDHYRLDLLRNVKRMSRTETQPDGAGVVISSEIRKGDSSRTQLGHDDLLGAGRMSSDADNILLLWPKLRPGDQPGDVAEMVLRIEKGRDGVQRGDIPLRFAHTRTRFSDSAPTTAEQGRRTSTAGVPLSSVDPLAGMDR